MPDGGNKATPHESQAAATPIHSPQLEQTRDMDRAEQSRAEYSRAKDRDRERERERQEGEG